MTLPRRILRAAACAWACSLALPAAGRDWMVDPRQGDDAGEGGAEAPLRSVAAAIARAEPGDTIHLIHRGEPWTDLPAFRDKSGAPGLPITLHGHGAVLSGASPLDPEQWTGHGDGLYSCATLLPRHDPAVIGRFFFLFDGRMERMGRSLKGPKEPWKDPAALRPGEWCWHEAEERFYLRVAPGQALAEARVAAPLQANGVSLSGECHHLVIRDLTATHVHNDGFNIHGVSRDILFQDIRAIECGDDGISAHGDCRIRVDGFVSIGNSTGMCHVNDSWSESSRVLIRGCHGYDVFVLDRGRHVLRDSVIHADAAQSVVANGPRDESEEGQCQLLLENVRVQGRGIPDWIKANRRSSVEFRRVTVTGGLSLSVAGDSFTLRDSLVAGLPAPQVVVFPHAEWTASGNAYRVDHLRTADDFHVGAEAFAAYQAASGQDEGSHWLDPGDPLPGGAGADPDRLPAWPEDLDPGETVVLGGAVHLGVAGQPEWAEFAGKAPAGESLELAFDAGAPGEGESCLLLQHRGVKLRWEVKLNGQSLGRLPGLEPLQITAFAVPPGLVRAGENRLEIAGPGQPDDIELGPVRWISRPVDETLGEASVEVRITDAASGQGMPCRLTLVTRQGALVPLRAEGAGPPAVREGVAYLRDGKARLSLPAGDYILWASRGFEWSASSRELRLRPGAGNEPAALSLERELPLPGWISVDTHIHTLTDSGHGDSTIDERMLTIAGEGIQLAVATDHNHHADYAPAVARTGTEGLFQHVTGNEVTTKMGHFNAFPIEPDSPVADASIEDWNLLLPAIRATPGVRVVILNHPRNSHAGFVPMGPTQFDTVTGRHRRAAAFRGIDGFEVVTSAAMQSDIRLLFRDWFALLNRGHRVSGVGSSDSHDVNRFILGQARTYVAAEEDRAGGIDLDEVWTSFEEGRLLVSMGLLAEITVNGVHSTGDLAPAGEGELDVEILVRGPSWTRADRVELYANGHLVREAAVAHPEGAIEKARLRWTLPRPVHDLYLVAIATGPGVERPFWEMPRPYQPASPEFEPRVIGATNPVWVDADGDGAFSAPLMVARELVRRLGTEDAALLPALASHDEAVAVQAAALRLEAGGAGLPDLSGAPPHVKRAFEAVAGQ